MASSTDRQPSSEFFDTRKTRTIPRQGENAPVLFRLPNLRVDGAHESKATSAPPAPVERKGTAVETPKSVSSPISSPSVSSVAAPTYTPVPAPNVTVAPEEAPKKWYAGWSNRLIILVLVFLCGIFAFRAMRPPNQDVAGRIMAEQGLTEDNLNQDVQLPSFEQKNVAQQGAVPGFLSTTPTTRADAPSANLTTSSPSENRTDKLGEFNLGPPTLDPSKDKGGISESPSLQFGEPSSSTAQNKSGLKADTFTGSDAKKTSAIDDPLEAPPLNAMALGSEGQKVTETQKASTQDSPLTPNEPSLTETQFEALSLAELRAGLDAARANRTASTNSGSTIRTASNATPSRGPDTTSSYSSYSNPVQGNNASALQSNSSPNAPRQPYQPIFATQPGVSSSDTMRYRPVGQEVTGGMAGNGTQLTGQAYPPSNDPPQGISIPTGGQVGPTISAANATPAPARSPYQPIGGSLESSNRNLLAAEPTNTMNPGSATSPYGQQVQGFTNNPSFGSMPQNGQPQGNYPTGAQQFAPNRPMTQTQIPNNNPLGLIPGTQQYIPQQQPLNMQQQLQQQPQQQQPYNPQQPYYPQQQYTNQQPVNQTTIPTAAQGYGGAVPSQQFGMQYPNGMQR